MESVLEEVERLYREAEKTKLGCDTDGTLHSHFGGRAYAYRCILSLMKGAI